LIGDALGLGRGDENKPLIYPTLRKAIVFSCFVGVFAIVEHMVVGLIHGKGLAGGWPRYGVKAKMKYSLGA
jgi:hypothetical protein